MIFFRTDANEEIATGHIMRCMTIGEELAKQGQQVRFLVSDIGSTKLLKEKKYEYTVLNSRWNCLDNVDELSKMQTILCENYEQEHRVPFLFVDSYFVTNSYLKNLKPFTKLAVFDDLGKDIYDVDLLINHNITQSMVDYSNFYIGKETCLLLGTQYVPLRFQFLEYIEKKKQQNTLENILKRKVLNEVTEVLIICGGGDPINILTKILREATLYKDFYTYQFHVVVGIYNPNMKELEELEKRFHNIILYDNVTNMAALMYKCDVAITTASTVLYECCAMGLPAIFFVMADNQEKDALAFAQDENMIYAGDVRGNSRKVIRNIFIYLQRLTNSVESQIGMSKHMREIVDGKGAERIAKIVCKMIETGFF